MRVGAAQGSGSLRAPGDAESRLSAAGVEWVPGGGGAAALQREQERREYRGGASYHAQRGVFPVGSFVPGLPPAAAHGGVGAMRPQPLQGAAPWVPHGHVPGQASGECCQDYRYISCESC